VSTTLQTSGERTVLEIFIKATFKRVTKKYFNASVVKLKFDLDYKHHAMNVYGWGLIVSFTLRLHYNIRRKGPSSLIESDAGWVPEPVWIQ
jgi:hypothetical protein